MQQSIPPYLFPPFSLNLNTGQLCCGSVEVVLRPKTFAVLTELVRRSGEIVTKEELLGTVWPQVIVHEAALKNCVREIRSALDDDAKQPRYIQTVHGRGYRFVAPTSAGLATAHDVGPESRSTLLIGREESLALLSEKWIRARDGQRQTLFINGEAGIGKTSLVEHFLAHQLGESSFWLARAQCIEQYGMAESFMPVLELLAGLCRGPGRERVIDILERYAPAWLARIPGLWLDEEPRQLDANTLVERHDMLLPVADAIDALSAERPVVLFIEDLQWSDSSTLELLALLARRRQPSRVLFVLTYRMDAVFRIDHPLPMLKQELLLHRQCSELTLRPLARDSVGEFVSRTLEPCDQQARIDDLSDRVFDRTEGHPMFMVEVIRHLIAREQVWQESGTWKISASASDALYEVPEELLLFIDQQVSRLGEREQQLLEVASFVGPEFSARVIPDSLGLSSDEIDECCIDLVRRRIMLRYAPEVHLDDGRVIQRYAFRHNLHREALTQRLSPARRTALYREIGQLGEALHGDDLERVSPELANLFEQGRVYDKACHYLYLCGQRALRLGAYNDARSHLTKGLELLNLVGDEERRVELELPLQTTLADVFMATLGPTAPETGETLARARHLSDKLGRDLEVRS